MNRLYKGVFYLLLSTLGFGVMPILALYAYKGEITVSTLLFIRFVAAAIILFLIAFLKHGRINVTGRNLLSLLLLGGVCYTLQSTLYFTSVKYITASLAVLILYTYPAIVYILSIIIDKERLTARVLASIILSFSGLVLVLGASQSSVNVFGVILAFAAALVYSIYIVLGNRVVKQLPPLITTAFVTFFAGLGLFVLGLSSNTLDFHFKAAAWLPILGLILFSTILAILTFFRGLELLGSTRASVLSMMEPLFTIIFSVALLKEHFGMFQAFGGGVVLLGTTLIVLSKEKSPDSKQ